MVLAQFICERQGDVLRKKRDYCYADDDDDPNSEDDDDEEEETDNNNNKVGEEESSTIDGGIISANVWDDACYGDKAYNEALAANLLDFSSTPRDSHHTSYCSNNSQENYDDMNDFQASEHQQHDLDSDQPAEDDNYVTETSNYGSGDTHHRKERDFSTELLEEYREKDNDLRNLTKDDDNPTLEEDNSVEGSGSNNHNHHHHNGREFSFELLEDYKEKESQLVNALQDDSLSEYAMFPN